jgi:hypothetical protein
LTPSGLISMGIVTALSKRPAREDDLKSIGITEGEPEAA